MLYRTGVVHERVFDFRGGPLPLVRSAGPPDHPLVWSDEDVEPKEYLPLAHGLALEANLEVPITSSGEPIATVEIGVVDGHPACTAIRALPGHQLTTRILRNLPGLGKLVKRQAAAATVRVVRIDGKLAAERYLAAEDPFWDAGRQELLGDLDTLLQPRHRRSLDDDFLRAVAEVYREARAAGGSTQRAIQERLGPTSEANARRWVARARKAGFLGAAPGRTGGEQPPTRRQTKRRKR